jgi:hypothetical protein
METKVKDVLKTLMKNRCSELSRTVDGLGKKMREAKNDPDKLAEVKLLYAEYRGRLEEAKNGYRQLETAEQLAKNG